jgi:hypothetical protein
MASTCAALRGQPADQLHGRRGICVLSRDIHLPTACTSFFASFPHGTCALAGWRRRSWLHESFHVLAIAPERTSLPLERSPSHKRLAWFGLTTLFVSASQRTAGEFRNNQSPPLQYRAVHHWFDNHHTSAHIIHNYSGSLDQFLILRLRTCLSSTGARRVTTLFAAAWTTPSRLQGKAATGKLTLSVVGCVQVPLTVTGIGIQRDWSLIVHVSHSGVLAAVFTRQSCTPQKYTARSALRHIL